MHIKNIFIGLLLASIICIVVLVSIMLLNPKFQYYKFKVNQTSEQVVQEIKCDDYIIQEVTNDIAFEGVWALPKPTRIETYNHLRIQKENKTIAFARQVNQMLPLHLPIQSGYVFGKYPHRSDIQGDISYGSSGYDSYSQSWFVDSSQVSEEDFTDLAKCIFSNKTVLETVSPFPPSNIRVGLGELLPIAGIYRLENAQKWIDSSFDTATYGNGKVFTCSDQATIQVDSPEYVLWKKLPKSFMHLGIKSDGSIALSWFTKDKAEIDFFEKYNLSTCVDENKIPITTFYKTIASKITKLY